MPTSSTSSRHFRANDESSSSNSNRRSNSSTYWPNERVDKRILPSNIRINSSKARTVRQIQTSFGKSPQQQASNTAKIKHISAPGSSASTSAAAVRSARNQLKKSNVKQQDSPEALIDDQEYHREQPTSLNIAGQSIVTSSKSSLTDSESNIPYMAAAAGTRPTKNTFMVSNMQYKQNSLQPNIAGNSQISLHPSLTSNSTTQLHQASGNSQPKLSIQRSVSLKYIKTLIILLMAVDLLITVFVHQFSTQDQLSFWFITSFKLRFSLLNLILSSIWCVILIGAILFEVYFILVISCLVNAASFILLFVFSIIHFSRRIDYNSVQLTSLLALLFSIVVLHVYLIVLTSLMIYLTIAVKRRQKSNNYE